MDTVKIMSNNVSDNESESSVYEHLVDSEYEMSDEDDMLYDTHIDREVECTGLKEVNKTSRTNENCDILLSDSDCASDLVSFCSSSDDENKK
ncbi:unnamed protein product [Ilex paraguariensis]|uniref:Uncharacterized protein n=1 Tax=Ilex paraguariensis TaxID=185542 RepID=A0ABC8RW45_9AQUA